MTSTTRIPYRLSGLAAALCLALSGASALAQNSAPNPFRTVEGWAKMPSGRTWGALSAIYPAPDGEHIWVGERCGANLCVESDDDPILLFDADGTLVKSFGAGMIAWPHGMFVDHDGNVWVADAVGYAPVPDGWGHVVLKFSPDGELLMTLGTKGEAGAGPSHFTKPSDVLVAPNGDIFVADGHDGDGNNRIVKFASDGTFLKEWGTVGTEDGQFHDPHALAMDSRGRLFVGDRGNNRIQIFDQGGMHLESWRQFGRPSGLFITADDTLYVADSESSAFPMRDALEPEAPPYPRNPGWKRGIRIGSARTGMVHFFIPDPEPNQDESATSAAEGVAVDKHGNVYGAEVGPRALKKYVRE